MTDQDDNVGWRAPSADPYGVPDNYFGGVDEEFYGVVGRIVMLASLVELQLFYLLCTLDAGAGAQERYAGERTGEMIKLCRQLIAREPDFGDAGSALLERVGSASAKRNDVVHNSWPHPTLDQAYGWRPARSRGDGKWIAEIEKNDDAFREQIGDLVTLVDDLIKFRERVVAQRWRRSTGAVS